MEDQIVTAFSGLSAAEQKTTLQKLQRIMNPTLIDDTFWFEEANGALLSRNFGYLKPNAMEALREKFKQLVDLVPVKVDVDPAQSHQCTDEASLRIYQRDADRTFDVEWRKKEFIDALKLCWVYGGRDYQQGLGYIVAFLMLFLDKVSVVRIALSLEKSPNHSLGYFKAQPTDFVRDARVMHRLIEALFPDVAAHMKSNGLVLMNCHMYCVKWFSGLGLHFFPFEHMLRYYQLYLSHGVEVSVRFSLAYIEALRSELLGCFGTNEVSALLRNEAQDHKKAHALVQKRGDQFFPSVMDRMMSLNLQGHDIATMRQKEGELVAQEMREKQEKIDKMKAEESDDGIEFSDEDC